MKKLLFILILGLTGGAFTSCTDLTTDLDLETNTRLVYFTSNPYSAQYPPFYTWEIGQESHTIEFEVGYSGLVSDKPLKFKLVQINFPPEGATGITLLSYGEEGVTYEKDQVLEIPAGQKSALVSFKFIKDPIRVESTNPQFKAQGWSTNFTIVLVNPEEMNGRWIGSTNIYVRERSIR